MWTATHHGRIGFSFSESRRSYDLGVLSLLDPNCGGLGMNPAQWMRLRVLVRSLHLELERMDWETEFELPELEYDLEFDLMPSGDENVVVWDQDHPDEIDSKEWPLCVECGNFLPSCVC